MQKILEKNIRYALSARNMSLADLSRISNVPYRTLQDILALKQATKITTLSAISRGLGVSPGKLLEDSEKVEKTEENDHFLKQLLVVLSTLDDAEIGMLLAQAKGMAAAHDTITAPIALKTNEKSK